MRWEKRLQLSELAKARILKGHKHVEDMFITQKGMYPFWLFADIHCGKFLGSPFVCFIGAHYEPGFVAAEAEPHQKSIERMKSGAWKMGELKDNPKAKVGWGAGKTPQEAFRKACYNSGYLKTVDATK